MLELPKLSIVTLNCKGIGKRLTRLQVFHYLRNLQADIICLQETHTLPGDAAHWTSQWAGPAVWSYHVGILLNSRHTIKQHSFSHGDRMCSAEVSVRGRVFTVVNLYAPALSSERRAFFKRLSSGIFDPTTDAFIVGDWNCCPNPSQDRYPVPRDSDHWRYFAPSLREYFDAALSGAQHHYFTFTHTSHNHSARLDHVFVSTRLASYGFSTDVWNCPYSDHKAVHLTVTPPTFERPLIWRLNTSLLDRADLWAGTERVVSETASASWDACKVLVRSKARDFAVIAARERNSDLRRLQRQLTQAENAARAQHRDTRTDSATVRARAALRHHTDASATRAILRARVRWLEQGERCSAYFFSRFRNQRSTSRLTALRDYNGDLYDSRDDRHSAIRSFYTRLYAAPTFDPPMCHSFLQPLVLPTLSTEDIGLLQAPISAEELASVVRNLPLRKAPGPDGLPYEWYRTYLSFLSPVLLDLFNGILRGEAPPGSWSATTLTLLPKPDRDHSTLRNWRPITLSNCDAKIFSKILANRLAKVLPRLLHPDQAGFVRGRSAPDIALTLKTVLSHAAEHNIDGALVFLDQEKAYDRVSHDYLSAVLQAFGFPNSLASVYRNTSGPSHTYVLDEGQPLSPVPISCGVRQGDPLAPLLFNLAVEPLLASLRLRLKGVELPWGSFRIGAFADDLTAGLAPTDGPVLQSVLDHYSLASNGLVNQDKSKILDLSGSPATPQWIQNTGFTIHDHQQPIRVLGYDLSRTPEGVTEDWPRLIDSMRTTALKLRTRKCALQGRALLANSLVLSKLWYKGRLSTPSANQVKDIRALAWEVVWAGKTGFKPSVETGRRLRCHGGVGFLDPEAQLIALQAMWIARSLTVHPHPPWWEALNFAMSRFAGGVSAFGSMRYSGTLINSVPPCWRPYVKAWKKLLPQWNPNALEWTPSEALALPIAKTISARARQGLRLVDLVDWNARTHTVSLIPADSVTKGDSRFSNPATVATALTALQKGQSQLPTQVVHVACSPSPTPPQRSSFEALHAQISVAGVMIASLTVSTARRFLGQSKGLNSPLPWNQQSLVRHIGKPPADIWKRLHHPTRSQRHKETFFKFIHNALALGTRTCHLPGGASSKFCHFCPTIVQDQRHFVFLCPLAQAVWHEFRLVFSLPTPVHLKQAAFSWSLQTRVLGRRYGHRLQAGHAVALHVLWLVHVNATMNNRKATIPAVRAQFRALLLEHLETLWASKPFSQRDQFLEDWSPPLSPSLPLALCI